MNREILFRGKIPGLTDWAYGYYAKSGECHYILLDTDREDNYSIVYPETVGQFTGLTDKIGTKIFEGDIVKGLFNFGLSINAKVVYYDGSFGVVCKRCGAINFTAFPSFCGVDWEVIGNIYDNPELMEETE